MKRILFSFLLLITAWVAAGAYSFMVDGIAYNKNGDGKSVTVTYTVFENYSNYGGLTVANIPATVTYSGTTYSVTSIGNDAFYDCNSLTSVAIPNSVTEIGDASFFNCRSLASLTLNEGLKVIGTSAFADCTSLKSVTIPNTVTTLRGQDGTKGCFEGCRGLTSVTIGNSVTEIGEGAFYGCSGLKTVFCHAKTPPTVNNRYNTLPSGTLIVVPYQTINAYKSANFWKNYKIIRDIFVDMGNNVGSGSFGGSGTGTASDPYLIFNPIQLYNVRNFTGYSDVHFKLMADIDLTEFIADNSPTEGWEPIGSQSSPFKGHFDGDGHTISGIKINRSTDCVGFFGCLDGAYIDSLTLAGSAVQGNNFVGALAGAAQGVVVNGVNVNLNVSGNQAVGGLIGTSQFENEINSCIVNANVSGSGDCVGGLTAFADYSNFNGNKVYASTVTGKDCTGGMIGYVDDSEISYCHADIGTVSGNDNVSGFIGWAEVQLTATDCYAVADKIYGNDNVSGFIGRAEVQLTATDCYAVVKSIAGNNNVGGWAGSLSDAIDIARCGSVADVAGASRVGGFAGCAQGKINNVFAVGDVAASGDYAGGVVANSDNLALSNGYYSGILTAASGKYVGGVVGYAGKTAVSNNYSNSIISGSQHVGGIVGYASGGSISSNVAAGEVTNAVNGDVGRVFGTNDSAAIGAAGTNATNRGLTTMRIVSQGLQITPTDGEQHGTNLGKSLLKYKTTYQGLGWDFTSDWTIQDTETFPYKPEQCAPPVFTSTLTAGGQSVSGQSVEGGKVYVIIDGKTYSADVNNHQWTVNVDALPSGATVKAYATLDGKVQSYYVTATVGYAGSGTESDPYLIYTASDLANINSYSYYKVMADIDLTQWIDSHSPVIGWLPVSGFRQLDGGGHTVSGLWFDFGSINRGLVGGIADATVKNLTVKTAPGKTCSGSDNTAVIVGRADGCVLENLTAEGAVSGGSYVGGIAGYTDNTTVTNCTAQNVEVSGTRYAGAVAGRLSAAATGCKVAGSTVTADSHAGGVAGDASGAITMCMTEATVSGGDYIGGIAGNATAAVTLCRSAGVITATDSINCRAGGIAGVTAGDIADCCSGANVEGGIYAGGIAGYSSGKIDNCYSCGDIAANMFGAGVVGYLDGGKAAVNHCFAINNRIDVSDQTGVAMRVIGGFKNGAATPAATNYANKDMAVSVNDKPQIIYDDVLEGKGVQLAVLKQQATYTAQGWDFTGTWGIDEGNGYPYLQWTVSPVEPAYIPGDANGDGSVLINDVVATANYIINGSYPGFVFDAADVSKDGNILVNDIVMIANIILNGEAAPAELAPATTTMAGGITAEAHDGYIDIALDNADAYSAMQMSVELPLGMTLKGASLVGDDSHTLMAGNAVNGKVTVAAFSTVNEQFNRGTVLRLEVEGSGSIVLDDIYAAMPEGALVRLDALTVNADVTGIEDINAAMSQRVNVYNTTGQLMKSNVRRGNAADGLQPGIYLIGNKKVVVK